MATVLVTGGAGYIGSHTCKALAAAGHLPVTYDSLETGVADAVKWGPLEVGDVADQARLAAVLAKHKPSAVLHFAAYIKVDESVANPGKYYRNNLAASLTLLEALRAAGIRTLVFSSSAAVYAPPKNGCVSEEHDLRANNPYGRTKHMLETILEDYGRAYDLKWIALRYFNAAGADPDGEIGLNDPATASLVPAVLRASLEPGTRLRIFGVNYDTPDGTGVRDFVHVTDLAVAHVLALEHLQHGGQAGPVNLGTETGYSVREVVRTAEDVLGRPVPADECPRRPGDLPIMIADSGKARTMLKWEPKHSSLEEIISTAARWEMDRRDRRFQGS